MLPPYTVSTDGRNFIGTLNGFVQTINIILDESHECVFSPKTGIEQIILGLHIARENNPWCNIFKSYLPDVDS
uniref:Sm domain-containing protein n=1 Tax=Glossina palpalis gambiensis TaxID=67801 RepID=A0A1B0BQG2_9MUSC